MPRIKESFITWIILLTVTGGWLLLMIGSLISPDREVPAAVHGLMGAVISYLAARLKFNQPE